MLSGATMTSARSGASGLAAEIPDESRCSLLS